MQITLEHLTKRFGDTVAVNDLCVTLESGKLTALLGPSGCGKSTVLNMISGILPVSAGRVLFDEKDVTPLPPEKRGVGLVFQNYALYPHMTALQNICFPMEIRHIPKKERLERARQLADMVHITPYLNRKPAQLSGGQQQRVALARAIVTKPKVLLLDEPLSAIDAKLRKSLQIEIRRIQKELNITTIFVTHDQDEAMIMSDRICLLNEGRIEQLGKPIEIYTDPKTRFAAGFIGNYNVLGPAEFRLLTGLTPAAGDSIAIRPETIAISREKQNPAGSYEWEGTVLESRSRGNVLRYTILVNGIRIYADTLFRSFSIFEDGAKVYLSVEKRNCLPVADQASGAA